jgi:site-specific DNA recombinase
LRATLASLWAQRDEKAAQVDRRVTALHSEVAGADNKLRRLYRMVEEGVTDLDEILKDRLKTSEEERDRAAAVLDRIRVAQRPPREIALELIERFGRLKRENVTAG